MLKTSNCYSGWTPPSQPAGPDRMIRIAISQAAFEAIAATLPLGSVAYEPAFDERGLRYIWLEARWLDRLKSYRGPGESYSDVILRVAADEA